MQFALDIYANAENKNVHQIQMLIIAIKQAIANMQIAAFHADPRAIVVGDMGAHKVDVFDRKITIADDPDGFSLGTFSVSD